MKRQLSKTKLIQYVGVVSVFAATLGLAVAVGENKPHNQAISPQQTVFTSDAPKIQLAILLDTSNSMDGLIDQARNQLWQVVNEFSKANYDGVTPELEVAVYEYGNDGLSSLQGYTRQVIALTKDLDRVSEALFSLTTNGGSEYCGYAIQASVNELQWSDSGKDIKTIFIAGNEAFTQGHVSYKEAITHAKRAGITVNTIHAGDYDEGVQTGWQAGAMLAGGDFMSIDHNQKTVHIVAPQDKEIAALNEKLNETYVPYGDKGNAGITRQMAQDENSNNVSLGMLAKRAKTKASSFYDNSEWDLVDAMEKNKLDVSRLEEAALPSALKDLDQDERQAYVAEKAEQRKQIKEQIASLAEARDEFVEKKKREMAETEESLDDALISAVKAEAKKKNYTFQ